MDPSRHVLLVLLTTLLTLGSPAFAGDSGRLHAEMIYRLAKFVAWPATDGDLTICNDERSRIQRHLRALDGKKVKGRKVAVRAVETDNTEACDVLWLGQEYAEQISVRKGMLTIGSGKGFLDAGGMVSIEQDVSQLVLHVNRTAVQEGELDISSQVLGIAKSVR